MPCPALVGLKARGIKTKLKMFEKANNLKEDPEKGFHCFCEELLSRMIGRVPDVDALLKQWRAQPDYLRGIFHKKEEEEESYLESMFLAWEESQEMELIVSKFEP